MPPNMPCGGGEGNGDTVHLQARVCQLSLNIPPHRLRSVSGCSVTEILFKKGPCVTLLPVLKAARYRECGARYFCAN